MRTKNYNKVKETLEKSKNILFISLKKCFKDENSGERHTARIYHIIVRKEKYIYI